MRTALATWLVCMGGLPVCAVSRVSCGCPPPGSSPLCFSSFSPPERWCQITNTCMVDLDRRFSEKCTSWTPQIFTKWRVCCAFRDLGSPPLCFSWFSPPERCCRIQKSCMMDLDRWFSERYMSCTPPIFIKSRVCCVFRDTESPPLCFSTFSPPERCGQTKKIMHGAVGTRKC